MITKYLEELSQSFQSSTVACSGRNFLTMANRLHQRAKTPDGVCCNDPGAVGQLHPFVDEHGLLYPDAAAQARHLYAGTKVCAQRARRAKPGPKTAEPETTANIYTVVELNVE